MSIPWYKRIIPFMAYDAGVSDGLDQAFTYKFKQLEEAQAGLALEVGLRARRHLDSKKEGYDIGLLEGRSRERMHWYTEEPSCKVELPAPGEMWHGIEFEHRRVPAKIVGTVISVPEREIKHLGPHFEEHIRQNAIRGIAKFLYDEGLFIGASYHDIRSNTMQYRFTMAVADPSGQSI